MCVYIYIYIYIYIYVPDTRRRGARRRAPGTLQQSIAGMAATVLQLQMIAKFGTRSAQAESPKSAVESKVGPPGVERDRIERNRAIDR